MQRKKRYVIHFIVRVKEKKNTFGASRATKRTYNLFQSELFLIHQKRPTAFLRNCEI